MMKSRGPRLVVLAVLVLPVAAACGSSDPSASQPADTASMAADELVAPQPDALAGVSFDVRRDPG